MGKVVKMLVTTATGAWVLLSAAQKMDFALCEQTCSNPIVE